MKKDRPASVHDQLVADIDAFLIRHNMSKTTFGIMAISNKHLVRRLREGTGISSHRIDQLYCWMAEYERGNVGARKRANHRSIAA